MMGIARRDGEHRYPAVAGQNRSGARQAGRLARHVSGRTPTGRRAIDAKVQRANIEAQRARSEDTESLPRIPTSTATPSALGAREAVWPLTRSQAGEHTLIPNLMADVAESVSGAVWHCANISQ